MEEVIYETAGFHQSSGRLFYLLLFLSLSFDLSVSLAMCPLSLVAVSLFVYSVSAQPLRHFLIMSYNETLQ